AGEWPSADVKAVRFWDTRTAWLNIEPAQDQWEFSHLDENFKVAESHGATDITMVLWGAPKWAAASLNDNDAPWMGPGSAAPPANVADWEEFVRKVAQRYVGRVKAYEIGNEPNLSLFWRGTPDQLADLVARAATVIHQEDPQAMVIAPAPYVRSARDATLFAPYLRALATTGARVDALSFHWYPATFDVNELDYAWTAMRRAAVQAGLAPLPIWVTEAAFEDRRGANAKSVSQLIPRTVAMARSLGISRLYFYAWTDMPIGNLLALHTGSPLERGLDQAIAA
ncbi:MAG: cellulase family glycosylhydrolase, partial [Candidatus Nanopelagicales bacterium]